MMETDWSVAAGADDPMIEAGWVDGAAGTAWSDLRVKPDDQQRRIAALPEAAATPALAHALALLNTPSGMLLTTKCDRWPLDAEERAVLADAIDAPVAKFGVGSYIDVLMAQTEHMADFLLHEAWVRMAARRCAALQLEEARLELVIRPARKGNAPGYGITYYCEAAGVDEARAGTAWGTALMSTIPVFVDAAGAAFAMCSATGM